MTTENKKHVENLVHHLDDVQKFVSTIWVKYHNPERLDEFRVALKRDGIINGQWNQTVAHFWIDPVRNELFKPCCPKNCPADLAEAFQRALAAIGDGEPIIETLLVEREDPSRALSWSNVVAVKPSEELYELAFSSWAETLNIEIAPESNQAAADPHKIRQQLITALILKLFSPKIDVQAWNACEHLPRWGKFEGEDFSQQTLDGIKLSSMGFKGANFDGTNLPGAVMTAADFSKTSKMPNCMTLILQVQI